MCAGMRIRMCASVVYISCVLVELALIISHPGEAQSICHGGSALYCVHTVLCLVYYSPLWFSHCIY